MGGRFFLELCPTHSHRLMSKSDKTLVSAGDGCRRRMEWVLGAAGRGHMCATVTRTACVGEPTTCPAIHQTTLPPSSSSYVGYRHQDN